MMSECIDVCSVFTIVSCISLYGMFNVCNGVDEPLPHHNSVSLQSPSRVKLKWKIRLYNGWS